MKKTCDFKLPKLDMKCKDVTYKPHENIYFNPETKEVKDEFDNILGTGELVQEILHITRTKIK